MRTARLLTVSHLSGGGGGVCPTPLDADPPRGKAPSSSPPPVNSMTDASKTLPCGSQKMALHEINLFLYKYYMITILAELVVCNINVSQQK